MIPIDPFTIGVGALLYLAFKKAPKSEFGVLTPTAEEVYRNAMEFIQDPAKLQEVAAEFQKQGLKAQAFALRKRAEWRGRSKEVREKHKQIIDAALKSDKVDAILEVASIFEGLTATLVAERLRKHAKEVREKAEAQKVPPEPERAEVIDE